MIPTLVFADEVVLKSGQKVEGKITEQTDKYVKIDSGIGMAVTYYTDEIDSIMGPNSSPQKTASGQTGNDQSLLSFKLGVNNVGEHKVIFSFPKGQMFDALCMNCETVHLWKNTSNQKAKLIVNLYDHSQKLIYADASTCADTNGQFPKGFFAPIIFMDIDKEKVKNIAYFSVSTQACPDADAIKISGDAPPESFIKNLITAIKQGKEAYLALFSSQPTSEAAVQEQEQSREFLLQSLKNGAQFTGFTPLDVHDAVKYGNICSDAVNVNLKSNKTPDKNAGPEAFFMLSNVSFPVGKCNGEWKILYA